MSEQRPSLEKEEDVAIDLSGLSVVDCKSLLLAFISL